MTIMTIERIRRVHACLSAMLRRLYCPECGAYLEGGSGELQDCHCGWKQPNYEDSDQ
nr:MAG TPA: Trm112p-like protein [Bacteriophage sp.]